MAIEEPPVPRFISTSIVLNLDDTTFEISRFGDPPMFDMSKLGTKWS